MCLLVISVSVQGSNDIRKGKESDKNSDNEIVEKDITINYEKEFCKGIDGIDEPYKSNGTTLFTISGTWIQEDNGRWWYCHDDGTYTCNGWEEIYGKWYYFDAEGWMVTGWQYVSGKWYYLAESGAMCIGWESIAGEWYYFDENGVMITGKYTMWDKETEKFKDYYFSSDGRWMYAVSLISWDLVDSGKHLDWSGKRNIQVTLQLLQRSGMLIKKG